MEQQPRSKFVIRVGQLFLFGSTALPAITPERLTGSGSGSVNYVIHLLDAGEPNFTE